uniref:U2A'/phosphoprotein 32 family A C-terminal domain-containing protein n=1 Tax=Coccolithus braarudii TaxID=221442 RepID=A0A7S0PUF2_9EUKA|mmetsp:Transcript_10371/g.22577  ORF Transcript_10371/g.22577 Transcript_10371/m.22577 type:complete len:304 (+) Transcript_10371:92-1003(+)|eukprot:CAMPEP_0183351032 /NCGR_PEP_ID=MMETSP0164_2-20130417/23275_1 /TAXON_ID=221442 /ORGANISM="Coccolithus pelagicus ssp braarudi, Strain PLY182g" /LENGTH=303 /DNA_ID=CAMNT_0025523119 /DNA_START=92 /DNA_END=1003 /DNA_ORIENTATION=-
MRLNADMIARSPAFLNPLKDRELDLRGNKIAVIENLASTQNQFDSIDISDNEIRKLECLAVLPRLKMLLLSNNRINRIADGLGRAFPNIETLVLTNNQLTTLKELEPLAGMPSITMLSLNDNLVTKQPNYRAFLISMLPKLKTLDYKKVKPVEREAAEAKYRVGNMSNKAQKPTNTFEPGAGSAAPAAPPKAGPTPEQIAQIKQAIAGAASFEEVEKLEKALKAGDYDYIAQHLAAQKGGKDAAPAASEEATEADAAPASEADDTDMVTDEQPAPTPMAPAEPAPAGAPSAEQAEPTAAMDTG